MRLLGENEKYKAQNPEKDDPAWLFIRIKLNF